MLTADQAWEGRYFEYLRPEHQGQVKAEARFTESSDQGGFTPIKQAYALCSELIKER